MRPNVRGEQTAESRACVKYKTTGKITLQAVRSLKCSRTKIPGLIQYHAAEKGHGRALKPSSRA
eukprot:IDg8588t1